MRVRVFFFKSCYLQQNEISEREVSSSNLKWNWRKRERAQCGDLGVGITGEGRKEEEGEKG